MARGSRIWTGSGVVAIAAVVFVTALGVQALTGSPAPEAEGEDAPIPMGEPMRLHEDYAPRFNDAQAISGPMPEGEWNGQGWLFVSAEVGRGVAVYDIATQKPVKWIYSPNSPVPHHPYISPDQRWVIADARFGSETIVIDTEDDFATDYLAFPEGADGEVAGPLHGTWTSDSRTFLVALQRSGRVGVVDLSGDEPRIADVLDVGARVRDIAITPDDTKAFVTMQREDRVAVIDLATWDVRYLQRTDTDYAERGSGSGGGMSSDGRYFAVANTLDDEVAIFDVETEELVHRVADVPAPVNVEFLGDTHLIGTGNRSDGSVSFIDADTGELRKTLETAGGANIPSLGPDGNIWVTHNGAQHVSVVNPLSLEVFKEVPTGVNPHWIQYTPWGSRAFVTNWGGSSVTVLDTERKEALGEIPTALNPNGMAMKTDVTEEEAARALARAEEEDVAGQIALAAEMVLPEPRDESEAVFLNTCTQCHDLGRIVRNNAKGDQWEAIVQRMQGNGAQMTPEEMDQIVAYLKEGRQADLDFGTRYDEAHQNGGG